MGFGTTDKLQHQSSGAGRIATRSSSSSCCSHPGRTGEILEGRTCSFLLSVENSWSKGCPGGEGDLDLLHNITKPYCGLEFARLTWTAQRAVQNSGTTRGTSTEGSAQAPDGITRAFKVSQDSGEQSLASLPSLMFHATSRSSSGFRDTGLLPVQIPGLKSVVVSHPELSREIEIQLIHTNTPVGSNRATAFPQGHLVEGVGGGAQMTCLPCASAQGTKMERLGLSKLRDLSLSL